MKNIKKFNKYKEMNKVELFIELYKKKDYIGATRITLSGWGTKELPLDENEKELIDKFISATSKGEQEQYDNAMRGATGTFG